MVSLRIILATLFGAAILVIVGCAPDQTSDFLIEDGSGSPVNAVPPPEPGSLPLVGSGEGDEEGSGDQEESGDDDPTELSGEGDDSDAPEPRQTESPTKRPSEAPESSRPSRSSETPAVQLSPTTSALSPTATETDLEGSGDNTDDGESGSGDDLSTLGIKPDMGSGHPPAITQPTKIQTTKTQIYKTKTTKTQINKTETTTERHSSSDAITTTVSNDGAVEYDDDELDLSPVGDTTQSLVSTSDMSESGSGEYSDTETETTASSMATELVTLPTDLQREDELIPVTQTKSSHSTQETSTKTSVSTVTNAPTSSSSDTVITSDQRPDQTTASNHSRNIEGRRRRPHEGTTSSSIEEVSIGAAAEGEDDEEKKVSYFAVIAAALISAIVFFLLGYITSRLRAKRGTFKLPKEKERIHLEVINTESGNGSAVNRDTKPTPAVSAYHEIHPVKPPVVPTQEPAEIHDKPREANATSDVPTGTGHGQDTAVKKPAVTEIKYMDETDDEPEAAPASAASVEESGEPSPSAPLLPGPESERGDLASQVLSTVDKNLNAIPSENDPLLAGDSERPNSKQTADSPL